MLQVLRNNGFDIASPTPTDLEEQEVPAGPDEALQEKPQRRRQDFDILSDVPAKVRDWHAITVEGFGSELISVDQDYKTPNLELDEAQVLDFYNGRNNSESSSPNSSLSELQA
jgi:hypothetical protein